MKKIVIACLFSLYVIAGTINLNFSKDIVTSGKWSLIYPKGQTSMLLLPIDVNFSDIQKSLLDDDGSLYIYTNEQTQDLLKVKFGVYFVGLVYITKSDIIYAVLDDAGQHVFDNFSDFSNYLKNNIETQPGFKDKDLFEKYYIPYLEKIRANGLYKIMPIDKDFTFNIFLPSGNTNTSGSIGDNSDSSNSGLQMPPSPPSLNQ